ncbi:hypothetical protein QAD02_011786 [Eretmocerus hayati]|uniref:Uncharacterized protein n=1 Tax=Eretmocerus hayati TaxID=131215 RepID=A0ACC2NXH2_9HYME|nr:hypothetical protein QAD02_011786 [Eretmocerus hayati]
MASRLTASAVTSGHIDSQQVNAENDLVVRRLHAPRIIDPRASELVLRCDYDLRGHELYSVSWYRNQQMLFKYQPSSSPPGIEYQIDSDDNRQHTPDVRVSINRSNATHLFLKGNQDIARGNPRRYEGTYACEVLIERTFLADYAMANVSAAILPKSDPVLEGLSQTYQVGEQLDATCTSAPSLPAAELTFYLNGQKIEQKFLEKQIHQPIGEMVSSSRLTLSITLDRRHFSGDSLKLTCYALLPSIPIERHYKKELTVKLARVDNQRLAQELPSTSSATTVSVSSLFICFLLIPGLDYFCEYSKDSYT